MKLWLILVSDIGLAGLVKRGLLGVGTKLELLDTNNGLKFVSEQFDSFAGYKVEFIVEIPVCGFGGGISD